MKRKRKNGEQAFSGWVKDGIYDRYKKEQKIFSDGFEATSTDEKVRGCAAIFGGLTGAFIMLWVCCGLTFSMMFGFSSWIPTMLYCGAYVLVCTYVVRLFIGWLYGRYIDAIDDTETGESVI